MNAVVVVGVVLAVAVLALGVVLAALLGDTGPSTRAHPSAHPAVPVAYVIDGDTFAVAGGDRVRVLGIDSAERDTVPGRAATRDARRLLEGRRVVLTAEPGVDRDAYGRLLRYVTLPDGRDLGEVMVGERHTRVYAGRHDAAPAYVARLQVLDRSKS
ncbi:thermonuclease family protein [Actinomycetospora rhizophila]|uniref:Thermonuclease family protein n=1 Tax=Actinomycetospora rhizophila TaxID=1416876 RepID=A0ABV9ZH09_9PSEU